MFLGSFSVTYLERKENYPIYNFKCSLSLYLNVGVGCSLTLRAPEKPLLKCGGLVNTAVRTVR